MTRLRFALAGLLGFSLAVLLVACLPSVGLTVGGSEEPRPAPHMAALMPTGTRQTMGSGGITFGGTASSSSAKLIAAWATATSYAVGQAVVANGNVCSCTTAGTSAANGSGPSSLGTGITDGPGTDGGTAVVWSCFNATSFRGILFTDTDGTNNFFVGFSSSITAGGASSGEAVIAGTSITLPAGLNVTSLYGITAGSSVAWTAMLTY